MVFSGSDGLSIDAKKKVSATGQISVSTHKAIPFYIREFYTCFITCPSFSQLCEMTQLAYLSIFERTDSLR
jgi:sulfur relay (sulfurtransferase) DsrC/TusE family protein